jgi:hypothetical protein
MRCWRRSSEVNGFGWNAPPQSDSFDDLRRGGHADRCDRSTVQLFELFSSLHTRGLKSRCDRRGLRSEVLGNIATPSRNQHRALPQRSLEKTWRSSSAVTANQS